MPWVAQYESRNKIDGLRRYFIGNGWKLFRTRAECRQFIKNDYGYIADRPDLKAEPHGWTMPKPVKVRVKLIPEKRNP